MMASSKNDAGLLLPDLQPGLVEDVQQPLDVGRGEAAAEVAGGGGVGDAPGAEGVEVDLVVAADLEVLQAGAAGQEVVGDVQDVVALVVGQVALQQVEVLVDGVDQADLPGQEVDGPDAAGGDGPGPVGDLVVDVGGGHHRPVALRPGPVLDAVEDSPLRRRILRLRCRSFLVSRLADFLRLCFRVFLRTVEVTPKPP